MRINIDIPDHLIHDIEVISAIEQAKSRKSWIETIVVDSVIEKADKYFPDYKKPLKK